MNGATRLIPFLLTCWLACGGPLNAQDSRPDIPDPECDGSTQQMVECTAEATAKWDKRLNEAYREAVQDGPKQQRDQLRKAQRLWLQYRDANCLYYGLGEGTVSRLNSASCMFDMTKARAKELEGGSLSD